MIPAITAVDATHRLYLDFLDAIKQQGFSGDINPDYANRIVQSTDNSIYQLLPQAVIYPKNTHDLQLLAALSNDAAFQNICMSARGGGTGTNGQSLTDGLIVDISKHMNKILEINPKERWVKVQAGVVKDQLNAALKEHGLFFAPELSTSNRATIGGMINTDASGQGSVLYGKTRDHVLALKTVLLDGTLWESNPLTNDELTKIQSGDDRIADIHRMVDGIFNEHKKTINTKLPKLNRCITGYDLAHIRNDQGLFDLNSVLCGAEGSLGFLTEATLNILPIPKYAALVNIKYASFEHSLRDAKALMELEPTSIETVDSKVLNLAMSDIIWDTVEDFFPTKEGEPIIQGINLVEFTDDNLKSLEARIKKICDHLDTAQGKRGKNFGYSIVYGADEINKIWAMRKKAVGLLGNAKGEKRPIPFVEDTAVPPEKLASYIMEFRAILDERNLEYGMFGHVDAGVLHVRPAIDMKDPEQEHLIREITDKLVALTRKYNGLLWGEHGKGVRSEYAPEFFGELYPQVQRIKGVFDPRNQLNPGKIATPLVDGKDHLNTAQLLKIDEVPTRGQMDRQISPHIRGEYASAMYCNGNGACFNYDPADAMCPSWKATRERIHSPKGRSSLVREWLRLMEAQGSDLVSAANRVKQQNFLFSLPSKIKNTLAKRRGDYDFSHEVNEAMQGCLACKSCVGQCPIKVNVPDFRSRFLEVYHGRYLRPAKDYLISSLEYVIPWVAKYPAPYNWAMTNGTIKAFFERYIGMVDSPVIADQSLIDKAKKGELLIADSSDLSALSVEEKSKSIIIVQDAFTSYFETQLLLDLVAFLKHIGIQAFLAPYNPNGKPLHVHGFMKAFGKAAIKNSDQLRELQNTGVELIGIDPSMTLTYRQEYDTVIPSKDLPQVQLIQEWLVQNLDRLEMSKPAEQKQTFKLLSHCTEKTSAASSPKQWQKIFSAFGQELELVATGCCGMSGTYGHEKANLETSKKIYQLSWSAIIQEPENQGKLVATGYSCRSQVKRMDDKKIPHPIQTLLSLVNS